MAKRKTLGDLLRAGEVDISDVRKAINDGILDRSGCYCGHDLFIEIPTFNELSEKQQDQLIGLVLSFKVSRTRRYC